MGHVALEGEWPEDKSELESKNKFIKSWTEQVCSILNNDGYGSLSGLVSGEGDLNKTYFLWDSAGDYFKGVLAKRLAIVERFCSKVNQDSEAKRVAKEINIKGLPLSRNVFLVHGHDEAAREKVARFLDKCGLEPIILHEQANQGRTIIEKFEAHSEVGFAVVLLTPDDMVGDTRRARQNVIFEMGYFAGKMGRRHVAALVADGVDIPSDLHGVVYIPLDAGGAWKVALARELRQAGLSVDAERILS